MINDDNLDDIPLESDEFEEEAEEEEEEDLETNQVAVIFVRSNKLDVRGTIIAATKGIQQDVKDSSNDLDDHNMQSKNFPVPGIYVFEGDIVYADGRDAPPFWKGNFKLLDLENTLKIHGIKNVEGINLV